MYLDLRFTDSVTLIPLAAVMMVKLVYNSGHTVCSDVKNVTVAEIGDRLATIDTGRKVGRGCCAPFRGKGWISIQHNVVWAAAYLRTK